MGFIDFIEIKKSKMFIKGNFFFMIPIIVILSWG